MHKHIIFTTFLFCSSFCVTPAVASPLTKGAQEALEFAMKKFPVKALRPGARSALENTLERAAKRHGTEVFDLVRRGGVELIEQGGKHGDELWKLARKYPQASRTLALHGDDLLPVVRRLGPEVLELELRNPGLGLQVIRTFGDDAARTLAKAPPEQVPVLLGYAGKADSPATRRLLLDTYAKSSNKAAFIAAFNWKTIMAAGLGTGAVIAAYQVSDGVQAEKISIGEGKKEGLKEVAKNDPEVFSEIMRERSVMERGWDFLVFSLSLAIRVVGFALLALVGFTLFRLGRWVWQRSRQATPATSEKGTGVVPPSQKSGDRTVLEGQVVEEHAGGTG